MKLLRGVGQSLLFLSALFIIGIYFLNGFFSIGGMYTTNPSFVAIFLPETILIFIVITSISMLKKNISIWTIQRFPRHNNIYQFLILWGVSALVASLLYVGHWESHKNTMRKHFEAALQKSLPKDFKVLGGSAVGWLDGYAVVDFKAAPRAFNEISKELTPTPVDTCHSETRGRGLRFKYKRVRSQFKQEIPTQCSRLLETQNGKKIHIYMFYNPEYQDGKLLVY